jgi:hypothetical protein
MEANVLQLKHMSFADEVKSDFGRLGSDYGAAFSMRLKTRSYSGADYDDEILANSGTAVTGSCLVFPLGKTGEDFNYVEQGLVKADDKKAYFAASVQVENNADIVVLGGSYIAVENGIFTQSVQGTEIFKKVFMRRKT